MPKPAPRSPWRWPVAVALAGVGLAAGGCGERRSGGGSTPEGAATPAAASPVAAGPAEPDEGAAAAGAAADAKTSAPAEAPKRSPKGQVVQDKDKAEEDEDEPRPAAAAAVGADDEPRGDRFADLEVLCAALNKDYVDGTLTDYYGALKGRMTTAFGDDLRRRGEASMEPGRILEAARKTLGVAAGDPATPACDKLFDELDDLE